MYLFRVIFFYLAQGGVAYQNLIAPGILYKHSELKSKSFSEIKSTGDEVGREQQQQQQRYNFKCIKNTS